MKNDTVVIQHHPVPTASLVKPSMPRTLECPTNKEFDKCTELLQSRRYSKSSTTAETNRKKQQQSPLSTRPKKQNSKITVTKSSFTKTNINNRTEFDERRSPCSPSKSLLSSTEVTAEEQTLLKNRLSPNKSRTYVKQSPSPTQIIHQRLTSPSKSNKSQQKSPPSKLRRSIQNDEELVRSSSCGDLPSSESRFILDQLITYLTRIRTISKEIRVRNTNTINDYLLWNDLESSLSSALSYTNNDIRFKLSLVPLQSEIIELRKQLQTTNIRLREYDPTRRNDEQYLHLQKKFDTNQIQCTQLSLHNEQLKHKCHLLQDKLDQLERNNIRLIQRLTQQDLRSIAQRTESISSDNHFFLRKEILFLKEKLYHIYDDLSTLFNRNHTLQNSIGEQKQQLLLYKQQLNYLKQSAQHLLRDLDNRLIEEKVKLFLNNILIDEYHNGISTRPHVTPTKTASSAVNSSLFGFETPHKSSRAPPHQPGTSRSRTSPPLAATSKLRPKSLFVTPTVLNDSEALFKFQENRSPTIDVTSCSSSTIDDADSTLTSSSSTSLYYQQRKRSTLYNSLPSLTVPKTIDMTKTTIGNQRISNNESGAELDQISDLTSKMFSSGEEDVAIGDLSSTSTSSSSNIPSDAERLMHV